jgi:hypothetical protein
VNTNDGSYNTFKLKGIQNTILPVFRRLKKKKRFDSRELQDEENLSKAEINKLSGMEQKKHVRISTHPVPY